MAEKDDFQPGHLPFHLVEKIVDKLVLPVQIPKNLSGLTALYQAWCKCIPFDNLFKRIHLESGAPGLLPGADPVDFFENWLRFGTGGTCWAGSEALYCLLKTLGFSARRCLGTMIIGKDDPPNHGTVIVECEENLFLLDTSMLHNEPLLLDRKEQTQIAHPAWYTQAAPVEGDFHVSWTPLHMISGCTCRISTKEVTKKRFTTLNEETRAWSIFNDSLYCRINRNWSVIGISHGEQISISEHGRLTGKQVDFPASLSFLAEMLCIEPEILNQLPPNRPDTPKGQNFSTISDSK